MENEMKTASVPIGQTEEDGVAKNPRTLSFREQSIERMGKFSWVAVLNQFLMGLGLLFLAIWLSKPYLEGWIILLALALFLSGSYYGWYISKQTEIRISKSGAAIFSYAGLWKKFMPMIVLLFLLRAVLMILDRQGIVNMAPMMRTLTFFIAGVFTARGITLLKMINELKKEQSRNGSNDTNSKNDNSSEPVI